MAINISEAYPHVAQAITQAGLADEPVTGPQTTAFLNGILIAHRLIPLQEKNTIKEALGAVELLLSESAIVPDAVLRGLFIGAMWPELSDKEGTQGYEFVHRALAYMSPKYQKVDS